MKELQTSSNNTLYLDILRIIACFFVIVNHTNTYIFQHTEPSLTWFASITYFFFCKTAVPLFVMITGALLLDREETYKKSAQRILRIFSVIILFSLLYYFEKKDWQISSFSLEDFIQKIYPENITNAFWYLYLYIGIAAILPVLQRTVKYLGKRDFLYYFIITFGIVNLIPVLGIFIKGVEISPLIFVVGFNSYLGMLLLGHYIEKYADIRKKHFVLSVVVFATSIAANVIATYYLYLNRSANEGNYLQLDDRTMTSIVLPSVCLFCAAKYICSHIKISDCAGLCIHTISRLTFGIYLLSDWLLIKMNYIYSKLYSMTHPLLAVVIYEIIIFISGALITGVLKKLPVIKKLI